MKLNSIVPETEVYNNFRKANPEEPFVTEPTSRMALILNPLRWELKGTWYSATIEEKDLEKINIISSHDWEHEVRLCENEDYKVSTASKNLNSKKENIDNASLKRLERIQGMIDTIKAGNTFDHKLVLVGTSLDGPFTVIDGNHRSVALFHSKKFVGITVYYYMYPGSPFYQWSYMSK